MMAKLNKKTLTGSVRVGAQGRIVIPAHIRNALGISPGQTLKVREEDGRLVLENSKQALARLQDMFAQVYPDVSLVDELIAERTRRSTQGSR